MSGWALVPAIRTVIKIVDDATLTVERSFKWPTWKGSPDHYTARWWLICTNGPLRCQSRRLLVWLAPAIHLIYAHDMKLITTISRLQGKSDSFGTADRRLMINIHQCNVSENAAGKAGSPFPFLCWLLLINAIRMCYLDVGKNRASLRFHE